MDASTRFALTRPTIEELNRNPTPAWAKMMREQAQRMREQAASTLLRLADNDHHFGLAYPGYRREFRVLHELKPELAKEGRGWAVKAFAAS